MAADQPIRAASLESSYINLANPGTYDATLGVAPTFGPTTGWTFAGSEWLNSNVIPLTNEWSVMMRFSGASSYGGALFGSYDASKDANMSLSPYSSSTSSARWYRGLVANQYTRTAMTSGVMALAGYSAYADGSFVGSVTALNNTASYYTMYIGAQNNGSANKCVGTIQALSIYNITLTDAQVNAITNAMNAL